MSQIQSIQAREILDSRGTPTLEVDLWTTSGFLGRAGVPSGASTGAHEACELRDEDPKRYFGKGVLKAKKNVETILAPALKGFDLDQQEKLDRKMIELDGTENKTKLGANALLGVSLAYAKASALAQKKPLYRWVQGVFSKSGVDDSQSPPRMPVPLMNVLNGGAHADNGLDVQEFMLVPRFPRFSDNLRAGAEVFFQLKKILKARKLSTAVGDEGGFAPRLESNEQALQLLVEAIESAGYSAGSQVSLALDVAATEFFQDGHYHWQGRKLLAKELLEIYGQWASQYPLVSIEDGFAEDDWEGWKIATQKLGQLQWVGDDLFVTNPKRLTRGIDSKVANALLVKVNQIGTLTETMQAVRLAQSHNYNTVMSHRSGETEDTTISHLAVGLGCGQIKTGSLCRGERTAKYNELLRIES